jgi:rRNA maturation endonuclease Nob1
MLTVSPQLALVAVVTTGAGVVMSRMGQHLGLLKQRHGGRCPSCGRIFEGRSCRRCGAA